MSTKPTLIVMAAGIGSRYGGLKQIETIGPNGEHIIDYSIYDALKAGFGKVVFVIKKDIEKIFRENVGKTIEEHCDVTYIFQQLEDLPAGFQKPLKREKPWGTGHAIFSCRHVVDAPFAVINGDDFYGSTSFQTLYDYLINSRHGDSRGDYCMVGYPLENTLTEHGFVSRGVCSVDQDGFLEGVRERTKIQKFGESIKYTEDDECWIDIQVGTIVSMNLWGFTPALFSALENHFPQFLQKNADNLEKIEYFIPDIIADLIHSNQATVKVLSTNEHWFGVTYKQDLARVRQAIKDLIHQGIYPQSLWTEKL